MHPGLEIEAEARARLSALLTRIPFANIRSSEAANEPGPRGGYSPDFELNVGIGPDQWRLVCEAKSQAQPRQARLAAPGAEGLSCCAKRRERLSGFCCSIHFARVGANLPAGRGGPC